MNPETRAHRTARYEFEATAARSVAGLGPAIRTFYGQGVELRLDGDADDQMLVNLVFRDGYSEQVELLDGPLGTGVWLSASTASQLGVTVEDSLTLRPAELPAGRSLLIPDQSDPNSDIEYGGDKPLPLSTLPVSAIYADLANPMESRFWCGVPQLLDDPTRPMLLMDEALLDDDRLGFLLLNASEGQQNNLVIDRPLANDRPTLAEARELASGVSEMQLQMATTPIAPGAPQTYFPPLDARPPAYESGLPAAVADAEARAAELRGVTVLIIATVAVLGAAAAGAAGVLWARRRRSAVIERAGAELGSAALGRRAAWEAVVPAVLGAVAGWASAAGLLWWAVSAFPGWPLIAAGALGAAMALLVGLGVVAVAAGITSSSLALDEEFRTRRELR